MQKALFVGDTKSCSVYCNSVQTFLAYALPTSLNFREAVEKGVPNCYLCCLASWIVELLKFNSLAYVYPLDVVMVYRLQRCQRLAVINFER